MHGKIMPGVIQLVISFALLSLLGPLSIHIEGVVPLTLQTFFVILPSMLFGWRNGAAVALLYLAAGSAGLPVFSGYTGGYEKLFGASGGYLIMFFFAAFIVGLLRNRMNQLTFHTHLFAWLAAHLVIISAGLMWQLQYTGDVLTSQLPLLQKLLVGAIIKSLVGAIVSYSVRVSPRAQKMLFISQ